MFELTVSFVFGFFQVLYTLACYSSFTAWYLWMICPIFGGAYGLYLFASTYNSIDLGGYVVPDGLSPSRAKIILCFSRLLEFAQTLFDRFGALMGMAKALLHVRYHINPTPKNRVSHPDRAPLMAQRIVSQLRAANQELIQEQALPCSPPSSERNVVNPRKALTPPKID